MQELGTSIFLYIILVNCYSLLCASSQSRKITLYMFFLIITHYSRYEDKRWIPRDGKTKSSTRGQEDKDAMHLQRPGEISGPGPSSGSEKTFEERKNTRPSSSFPSIKTSILVPPKVTEQVI